MRPFKAGGKSWLANGVFQTSVKEDNLDAFPFDS